MLSLWYVRVVIESFWYGNDVSWSLFFVVGMKYAAYNLDKIEQKMRSLHESAKYTTGDGTTTLDANIDYFLCFLHFQSSLLVMCFDLIDWIVRIILAEVGGVAGAMNEVDRCR